MAGQQRDLRVVISGDSVGVRKALGETDAALGQTTTRIEGFGKSFLWRGVPVSGPTGTYAGVAAEGARLLDVATGQHYKNTGTQAAPVWVASA